MRNYELTFIIAPGFEDEDIQAVVEKVSGWIEADGGQVTSVDFWGQRRLAYPIQDYSEGIYVLLNVQLEPTALGELERNLKLDTSVIRYLLVRVEE